MRKNAQKGNKCIKLKNCSKTSNLILGLIPPTIHPPDITPLPFIPMPFTPYDYYPLGLLPPMPFTPWTITPLGLLPPRISTPIQFTPRTITHLGLLPPRKITPNLHFSIHACPQSHRPVFVLGGKCPRGVNDQGVNGTEGTYPRG